MLLIEAGVPQTELYRECNFELPLSFRTCELYYTFEGLFAAFSLII